MRERFDGGHILFYNEHDHHLLWDSDAPSYSCSQVVNYHKQLFTRASFERFLQHAGFESSFLGYRRSTMLHLARSSSGESAAAQPSPETLQKDERLARNWYKDVQRSVVLAIVKKPIVMAKHGLRWFPARFGGGSPRVHPKNG